jgi:hypothetical protein
MIDGYVTGTVTSTAKHVSGAGESERLKVTVTTSDAWGKRVNAVCSSSDADVTDAMRVLQLGDLVEVRGGIGVVVVVGRAPCNQQKSGALRVRAHEVIKHTLRSS